VEGDGQVSFKKAAESIHSMVLTKTTTEESHVEAVISSSSPLDKTFIGDSLPPVRSSSFTERVTVALRAENEILMESIEQQREEIRLLREEVKRLTHQMSGT